jgi:hypothetical protein
MILNVEPPFVWPEPRVIEGMCTYPHQPPIGELALASRSLFGIVSALTVKGVEILECWLKQNPGLHLSLVLTVYPTCATRQSDIERLLKTTRDMPNRISVHVRPLQHIADRSTSALCFLAAASDTVHVALGAFEDMGVRLGEAETPNFIFRADPLLIEAFKRYFDWLWGKSREISAAGVTQIPDLVIPAGTLEGARLWQTYFDTCTAAGPLENGPRTVVRVDPDTGDVMLAEGGQPIVSPTEKIGLKKLDAFAERIARLYEKGVLVNIDKLSRIPPLDVPLDPSVFGDASELHKGKVSRKVSMRVSIINEKTLKEIDKRRQSIRTILTKFSFRLADNVRWMPSAAQALFESELERVNKEGQTLISDLLKADVDAFIAANREALIADINAMYAELGRPGKVTPDVIIQVEKSLKERLGKAKSANFMPKLSHSNVSFSRTDNAAVSPWGQAFSLLADVAAFPREAVTDSFFFRGLKVGEEDLIEVMNVADDALCHNLTARGIKDRCKAELGLLSRIEKASIDAKDRCGLVFQILAGDTFRLIEETLKNKEAS